MVYRLHKIQSIAHLEGFSLNEAIGSAHESFDEALKRLDVSQLTIEDGDSIEIDRSGNVEASLLVDILRLVDTLNPKTESVWNGVTESEKPSVLDAIKSVMVSANRCAVLVGFTLDDAAKATLDKLDSRARRPHVVDEVDAKIIDSGRDRISSRLKAYTLTLLVTSIGDQSAKTD